MGSPFVAVGAWSPAAEQTIAQWSPGLAGVAPAPATWFFAVGVEPDAPSGALPGVPVEAVEEADEPAPGAGVCDEDEHPLTHTAASTTAPDTTTARIVAIRPDSPQHAPADVPRRP